MKVFDLVCDDGHRFEGWFASAEQYAEQCDALGVRCPLCDSVAIHREPSAPRLNLGGDPPARAVEAAHSAAQMTDVKSMVLSHLRRLIAATEDVGQRFPEEARRIHYEETPARPIRGIATDRERLELQDEGIDTLSIPIPHALTETLQ